MLNLSFRFFGPFEAAGSRNESLRFPTTKAQALLAYLLVEEARRPGISHQRGKLMTLLWPDITPESAQTNLRQTLYRLRRVLPPVEVELGRTEHLLSSDRQSVNVNPSVPYWLDVARFERLLREAEEGSTDRPMTSLEEAAALYRGPFLADVLVPDSEYFENWATQIREELRRKALEALQQIGDAALTKEEWDRARAAARQQIAIDQLNEGAYRQLMLARAMAGQRNEALAEFAALKQLLAAELGVEPTSETAQLAEAIREDQYERPGRPAPMQSAALRADSKGRQAEIILLDKVDRFWVKGVLQQSLQGAPPLALGMETAPEVLAAPWELVVGEQTQPRRPLPTGTAINQIFEDSGGALLILGEPGAGKTTTLLELARAKIEEARADSAAPLPVVFNLRSWADRRPSIAEWLVQELNIKYLIPLIVGRAWVEAGRLLLILDGLDEVQVESQAACVTAINAFRQEFGLVQMAVSSRATDYGSLPVKLRLGEAIRLQPLKSEEAAHYLQESAGLQTELTNILDQDSQLANLAQSPLMLNIMALTFQSAPAETLGSLAAADDGRQQLLDRYVEHMYQRRGKRGDFPPARTTSQLGWLARSLNEHNQTVFLLEQLQPSWLNQARSRWVYVLTTRIIVSVFLALGYFIAFAQLELQEFSLTAGAASLIIAVIIGVGLGSVDAARFRRQLVSGHYGGGRDGGWTLLARVAVVGLLALLVTTVIFLAFGFDAEYTGGIAYAQALIFALFFGVRGRKRSVDGDIRPIETVVWSWAGALSGSIPGLVVGAVLGVLDQYVTGETQQISVVMFFAILGALFTGMVGGLRRGVVASQDRPNSGIVLSLRYGLRVGLVFGLVTAVAFLAIFILDPVNDEYRLAGLLFALRVGFVLGCFALLWYGGIEVLHHTALRILLRFEGSITPRYTDFLDHAVDLIFLRRVGGGYIFMHQLLHDYFAREG